MNFSINSDVYRMAQLTNLHDLNTFHQKLPTSFTPKDDISMWDSSTLFSSTFVSLSINLQELAFPESSSTFSLDNSTEDSICNENTSFLDPNSINEISNNDIMDNTITQPLSLAIKPKRKKLADSFKIGAVLGNSCCFHQCLYHYSVDGIIDLKIFNFI